MMNDLYEDGAHAPLTRCTTLITRTRTCLCLSILLIGDTPNLYLAVEIETLKHYIFLYAVDAEDSVLLEQEALLDIISSSNLTFAFKVGDRLPDELQSVGDTALAVMNRIRP